MTWKSNQRIALEMKATTMLVITVKIVSVAPKLSPFVWSRYASGFGLSNWNIEKFFKWLTEVRCHDFSLREWENNSFRIKEVQCHSHQKWEEIILKSFNKYIKKSLNIKDRGNEKKQPRKICIVSNKKSRNLMGMQKITFLFIFKLHLFKINNTKTK